MKLKSLLTPLIFFSMTFTMSTILQAQKTKSVGTFSGDVQILANTSTALTADTTMIDSVSNVYRGWPVETIYYKFLDAGTVATTLYFESRILANLSTAAFAIIDSLVVSSTSTLWNVWNVTANPIGVNQRWRLRKSVTSDTLMAIFNGYSSK